MKLGELEKMVMDYVWECNPESHFTIRMVVDGLRKKRKARYAYNTILTVVTHLYAKKLLQRNTHGKAFAYSVNISKEAFVAATSREFFNEMRSAYGQLAIAHFASMIDEIDPKLLKEAKKTIVESS